MIGTKGFFILPSELFANVCRNTAQDDNLNEPLETILRHIKQSAIGAESEDNFWGLFDAMGVNSKKLGGLWPTATKSWFDSFTRSGHEARQLPGQHHRRLW